LISFEIVFPALPIFRQDFFNRRDAETQGGCSLRFLLAPTQPPPKGEEKGKSLNNCSNLLSQILEFSLLLLVMHLPISSPFGGGWVGAKKALRHSSASPRLCGNFLCKMLKA